MRRESNSRLGVGKKNLLDYLADGAPRVFPNVELPGVGAMPCGDVGVLLERTIVTWEDLRWMRDAWKGPVVVTGVHIRFHYSTA